MPNEKKTGSGSQPWHQDVVDLTQDSVVAEATAAAFTCLDNALGALDDESRELMRQYFDGTTVEELSRRSGLSATEISSWIARSKRELIHGLRQKVAVKQ